MEMWYNIYNKILNNIYEKIVSYFIVNFDYNYWLCCLSWKKPYYIVGYLGVK